MTPGPGFEWDARKRLANLARHGIDFADVPEVFEGPMWRLPAHEGRGGEPRVRALGFLGGIPVAVVYTLRGSGSVIRLISARPANRTERRHMT